MRVTFEQLGSGLVRLGLNDHVPQHAVLDVGEPLGGGALRFAAPDRVLDVLGTLKRAGLTRVAFRRIEYGEGAHD